MTTTQTPDREPTNQDLAEAIEKLSEKVDRFDTRFGDYQKATQWVVQLAFTLIASTAITVILTAVLR